MRSFTISEAEEFLMTKILWGNGAGFCRRIDEATKLAQTGAPLVVAGSFTMKKRNGNPGHNLWLGENGESVNAMGLPNDGLESANCRAEIVKMRDVVHSAGSKFGVSISAGDAFDVGDYFQMSTMVVSDIRPDILKVNMSCPNRWVDGVRKPPVCSCPDDFERGVYSVMRAVAGKIPVAIKLAPIVFPGRNINRILLYKLAGVCLRYGVDYIVVGNTLGGQRIVDATGKPVIPMEFGGLGGKPLIPIVIETIRIIKPLIAGTKTKLLALGGVANGLTAWRYLNEGANGFLVATELFRDPGHPDKVFEKILLGNKTEPGLLDLLVANGLQD